MQASSLSLMRQALLLAEKAGLDDEVPVGALIVDGQGAVIAKTYNRMRGLGDPTAHAEILAIREACQNQASPRLPDCDIYVTLEPCPMCAQAISFARLRRLYFGAYDPKGGGVEQGPVIFSQKTCHHSPEIIGGIYEGEAGLLLEKFFRAKRGG